MNTAQIRTHQQENAKRIEELKRTLKVGDKVIYRLHYWVNACPDEEAAIEAYDPEKTGTLADVQSWGLSVRGAGGGCTGVNWQQVRVA